MRESAIENLLVQKVREMGGVCLKLTPTVAGVPDRVVLMPHGKVQLVELKALGGVVSKVQKVWHARSLNRGYPVHILTGRRGLDEFITMLREEQALLSRPHGVE